MHLIQQLFKRYQSDGFKSMLFSTKKFISHKIHNILRRSRLVRGEWQFKKFTEFRYMIQTKLYDAPSYPWRTIKIDPKVVKYKARPCKTDYGLGRIVGGDWDLEKNLTLIQEQDLVKGLKQRFVEGRDWRDTTYVKRVEDKFDKNTVWGYQNLDEFLNTRCEFVDELFNSIKKDGYRPNYEAEHTVPESDSRNRENNIKQRLEPLIAIGRNGEIYWRDGYHRLTIAQILNINSIPVNVVARHKEWQRIREITYGIKKSSYLNSHIQKQFKHPDLADIISGH